MIPAPTTIPGVTSAQQAVAGLVHNTPEDFSHLHSETLQQALQSPPVTLCDCRNSTDPHGLICHGAGWFVTGFKNTAKWQADHSTVPLGPAECCRVCVELIPDAAELRSLGCHKSLNSTFSYMECEAGFHTVVTGYQDSHVLREKSGVYYYPEGPVTCCKPVVLMSDGGAAELEWCDCSEADGVSCTDPDQVLVGFEDSRITHDHKLVPVGNATCCRLCPMLTRLPPEAMPT